MKKGIYFERLVIKMKTDKTFSLTCSVVLLLFLTLGCLISSETGNKPGDSDRYLSANVYVNELSISVLESFPVQIHLQVKGDLPDPCTSISSVEQKRIEYTFYVKIMAKRPADVVCAQVLTSFEEIVRLDVHGLKAGVYNVDVNGVKESFELSIDNIIAGTLEGQVSIGPICPVERPGVSCEPGPEVFAARKIIVYNSDRSKVVSEIVLGEDGKYKTSLNPGFYVIDINSIGVDRSGDVPRDIEIQSGETVTLNIDIDTGIR
jgi:inhibitor of cysteine peptidase